MKVLCCRQEGSDARSRHGTFGKFQRSHGEHAKALELLADGHQKVIKFLSRKIGVKTSSNVQVMQGCISIHGGQNPVPGFGMLIDGFGQ